MAICRDPPTSDEIAIAVICGRPNAGISGPSANAPAMIARDER
jgi:hypothetical protein